MKKAFIFDLDGVLIDNEKLWQTVKDKVFLELLGQEQYAKLGITVGMSKETIWKKLVSLGTDISIEQMHESIIHDALIIYKTAPLTQGIEHLGELLVQQHFTIGVVSASPREWVDIVVKRLPFRSHIPVVISLEEREDLAHKPAPDGYLEAIKQLGSTPTHTIILEDSNTGIASAKAAGAYVIGLKQNLIPGYTQKGADMYVEKVAEIHPVIKKF